MIESEKSNRMLEIFFRALHGEAISSKALAQEYQVSTKSIGRDISRIQNFLAENRSLMQNAELTYSHKEKAYCLTSDEFLKNKELFALVEVILGCRCFQKEDALNLITKLKRFTTVQDRKRLEKLIQKEVYHYHEVRSDCAAVIDTLWKLIRAIDRKRLVTITYYKMNREEVKRKIRPASVMFSEYYFYLIAYPAEDAVCEARYFRVDRITSMTEHREQFHLEREYDFDEGDLREKTSSCSPARQRRSGFPFPAHPCRQSWTGFPPQKSWRKTVRSASSRRRSTMAEAFSCTCSPKAHGSR